MPVAIKKYKFYIIKIEFCGFIMELKKLNVGNNIICGYVVVTYATALV